MIKKYIPVCGLTEIAAWQLKQIMLHFTWGETKTLIDLHDMEVINNYVFSNLAADLINSIVKSSVRRLRRSEHLSTWFQSNYPEKCNRIIS